MTGEEWSSGTGCPDRLNYLHPGRFSRPHNSWMIWSGCNPVRSWTRDLQRFLQTSLFKTEKPHMRRWGDLQPYPISYPNILIGIISENCASLKPCSALKTRMLTNSSFLWKIELNFVLFRKCFNYIKKYNFLIPVFGKTFSGKTNKAAIENLTVNHSFVCPTLFEKKKKKLHSSHRNIHSIA